MLSLESLEAAAASLGMRTARAQGALKVWLFRGVELSVTDGARQRTQSVLYLGMPAAVVGLGLFSLFMAAGFYFALHRQLDRSVFVWFLVLLPLSLALWDAQSRVERAQDRLDDRAFHLHTQDAKPGTAVAERWVPSLSLLERAADSLGLNVSRSGASLSIRLGSGHTGTFSGEGADRRCSRRYGRMPVWLTNSVQLAVIPFFVVQGLVLDGGNSCGLMPST